MLNKASQIIAILCLFLSACQSESSNKSFLGTNSEIQGKYPNNEDQNSKFLFSSSDLSKERDSKIYNLITRAIMMDSNLSEIAKDVKVSVENGVVTLRGDVKDEQERQDLETIVSHVYGVVKIDNQVEVTQKPAKIKLNRDTKK